MDGRFSPLPLDSRRQTTVFLFGFDVTPLDVITGAAEGSDVTRFVYQLGQTQNEISASFAWHTELNGISQPKPGQIIAVYLTGVLLAQGIIESINDYRLESGQRSLSVTARSRDATPAWREVPRITTNYPQGARLEEIAQDVATSLGLSSSEIVLPATGTAVPQSSAQLAQIPAWQMFEQTLLPGGFYPFVDSIGRLKAYSRDVLRPADIVLTDERIRSISGSRSAPGITRLKLKWRDPNLTLVKQQDRALGSANITAGFFQLRQRQEVYFSEDRTQRALDTRLVVKQSANSGLLPICDEEWRPFRPEVPDEVVGGEIVLETYAYVPALIAAFVAVKAASLIPDGVQVGPTGTGSTISIGRFVHGALELGVLLVLASIGTGSYEIWGTPYDYVNAVNTTEAYDDSAPEWTEREETIESDFIANEAQAQSVVTREFMFRALSSSSYGAVLVDDPRIEVGDILQFPDGSRLFVTGFSRDLAPGTNAVVNVSGFPV